MEKKYSIHVIDDGFVNCHPGYITGNAAWPSVTKDENGILYTVYSGNRLLHVDPFGKVFLRTSRDEGKTWSSPRLVIDTPLDDRDAGILNLGNGHLLVSSFNLAPVKLKWSAEIQAKGSPKYGALMLAYLALVTEEQVDKFHGSLFSESFDGGETWSEPFFSPVTAPHGPTLTKNREILYAGNRHDCLDITEITAKQDSESIFVYKGKSPHELSLFCKVPPSEETKGLLLYEPYIIELPSGRLVLHVRLQGTDDGLSNEEDMIFTIGQSVSDDGGKTWSSLHIITEYG
ncbi:MAG: exo-alpha-sialidase, partial [Candidatus Brocadia sp.]